MTMELGIYTFAELATSGEGPAITPAQRMRNLVEEIELADQAGLDVFGVGEHHRPDFVVSSPAVALAAGAEHTKGIRLTSAVSVLSSDDPIRVFQDFATLDLLSGGRAEIMAGRGSFIESFPLFGYDLDDYDDLFAEKLELLIALTKSERVTWPGGRFTTPIEDLGIYPQPVQQPLPVWIAVGGSPNSVARAGVLGLPLAVAIIGGQPERFAPLVDLYRNAAQQAGHDPSKLPVSINSHGYVGDPNDFFPAYAAMMNRIGRERGWPPITRQQFEAGRSPQGHLLVGNSEQVAEKILAEHEIFGNDRFMLQMSVGPMDHAKVMRSIELFGTEVAPRVRREVDRRAESADAA
jgi:probable LLM family oxidoreductase